MSGKEKASYRSGQNYYPGKVLYFESIKRRDIYYVVIFTPDKFVLDLIMRGNSASCYVGMPPLGGLGVRNDAKKTHGN